MVELIIPNEAPLTLLSVVRRQQRTGGSLPFVTGLEFKPFGGRRGGNPHEALDVLRRLDKAHGGDA